MADPIAVAGGVAAIAQIAVYCMKSIQTMEHLRIKYRDGFVLLDSLYKESHLIHASLLELDELFHDEKNLLSAALRAKPKLFTNLERTLSACDNVYRCLSKELEKLANTSDMFRTTRMITKEKVLQEYLVQINSHKNTLTLLIQGIQMHSLNMIIEILTFQNPMIRRMGSMGAEQDNTLSPDAGRPGLFHYDSNDPNAYPSPRTLVGSSPTLRQTAWGSPRVKVAAGPSTSPLSKADTRTSSLAGFDEEKMVLPPPSLMPGAFPEAPQLAPISTDEDDFGDAFKIVISPGTDSNGVRSAASPLSAGSEDTDKTVVSSSSPSDMRGAATMSRGRSRSSVVTMATVATTTSMTSLENSTNNAAAYFPPIPNRPANVPLPLDEVFTKLDNARQTMLQSTNRLETLRWAEEVFSYTAFVSKKPRLSAFTGRQAPVESDLSVAQQHLEDDAKLIVEDLADVGDGKALYLKARWYTPDQDDKLRLLNVAYGKGYIRAAARIAAIMRIGSQTDKKTALGYLQQGKTGGDAAALFLLAEAYFTGEHGAKKNHKEAAQLMRAAAQRADVDCPEPAFRFAELTSTAYRKEGSGRSLKISKSDLPIDDTLSLPNYGTAALHRHPKALLKLGLAYQDSANSLNLPISAEYSLHYLHLASQAGEIEADSAICNWFWFGQPGVLEANGELAFKFARKAAEYGWVKSYCQVGWFLEQGVGVQKDMSRARDWYLRGAAAGDEQARKRLDALISRLRM